jgi:acetylglutamate kinase
VVVLGLYAPGPTATENAERLQRRLARVEVPVALVHANTADLGAVAAAKARAGEIPVVFFDRGDATSELARRFAMLGSLSADLQTRKLIFLSRRGGLRPRGADRELPIINLATDYEGLIATQALRPKQLDLLARARGLLVEATQHRMLVAVTSPLSLLTELFTVKGAGTLIKRGSIVGRHDSYAGVDAARLRALLDSSFGRPVAADFFERPVSRLYLEADYRGAALIVDTPLGAYLTKFAVDREAQGEGIGRDLWQVVVRDYPMLFWRARPSNPIAAWYTQECDGVARFADWHVFWRGLATAKLQACIEWTLAQPPDFQSV